MFKRVTFLTAAVLLTLFSAGCGGTLGPAPERDEIRFEAGSMLLLDDGTQDTKGGTIKDAFAVNDMFFVWGAKTISATRYTVFSGQSVTLQSLGADPDDPDDDTWTYAPTRFWDSNASQYDFLAISGPPSTAGITCNPTANSRITASIPYSPVTAQYDIVAAGYKRQDGSTGTVSLGFNHILSAVSVVVYNDSPSGNITLNSFGFKGIRIGATGTVEQNGNGISPMGAGSWISPSYALSPELGCPSASTEIAPGSHYPTSTVTDLMIPQGLVASGGYIPQLVLDYEYNSEQTVTPIRLDEIQVQGSEDFITEWLPNTKYNYEIHIRMGGGIRVTVTATDWETVPAETPGVTIS